MKMGSDTVIRGLSYKKPEILYYSHRCELPGGGTYNAGGTVSGKITGGFYREDTTLHRVYCLVAQGGDTIEHIIYDAGWRIGDTVKWGSPGSVHNQSAVTGYDSAFLNNSWHKAFRMVYTQGFGSGYDIVEGIGSTKGPGFPAHALLPFENDDRLRCFNHAGYQPPITLASGRRIVFDNSTSCNVSPLGVQRSKPSVSVKVVPNPGGNQTVLQIGLAVKSGNVRLTDVSGQMVASFGFREKEIILIGQYLSTPGIYYYSLQDAGSGNRYTGRFIFQ